MRKNMGFGSFWYVQSQWLTEYYAGGSTVFEICFIVIKQDKLEATLWTNNSNSKAYLCLGNYASLIHRAVKERSSAMFVGRLRSR